MRWTCSPAGRQGRLDEAGVEVSWPDLKRDLGAGAGRDFVADVPNVRDASRRRVVVVGLVEELEGAKKNIARSSGKKIGRRYEKSGV